MTHFNQMDETRVKRGLLTLVLAAGTVFISFYAIRRNDPIFMMLVPAVAIGAWLIGHPSAMLLAMILTDRAAFLIPGLPGGVQVEHLFAVMITGWAVLYTAIVRPRPPRLGTAAKWMILFIINVIVIVSVRGFGMALTGSTAFGGKTYIFMMIGLLLYFSIPVIRLEEKHVKILFFGGLIASFIPFLVQLSVYVTGGATSYLTNFIDVAVKEMATHLAEGDSESMVRWGSLGSIAGSLAMIAMVLPSIRSRRSVFWGLIILSFGLTAMTGFRGQMVARGAIVFAWLVYDSKNRAQTFFSLIGLGLIGWLLLLAILPVIPSAAQRAVSFLPLAKERISDPAMLQAAQASVDWRVEVWKEAWRHVPEYLFIGRGLTFDVTGWAWLQSAAYATTEFNYANHNYHSGPISLLVDFGLPGFICATAFMLSACATAWRGVRRFCVKRNDIISRLYAFSTIGLTWQVISYFLIFGHAPDSLPQMARSAAMLVIFQRVLMETEGSQKEDDARTESLDKSAAANRFRRSSLEKGR